MEKKMVIVPFDVELAKKITNGEVDGQIVTRDGRSARIICFDAHCEDNIVALVEDSLGIESTFNYLNDGKFYIGDETECDLFIEIPEYMTFKDGDVIAYDSFDTISITMADIKCEINDVFAHYYVELRNGRLEFNKVDVRDVLSVGARIATEEERQKLIDALKASKEPKAKEYLKRFFGIEVKQECEFKPFDKVLVRDDNNEKWRIDLFSHQRDNGLYVGIEYSWKYCIPYNEQTAKLLGTTEDYKGD